MTTDARVALTLDDRIPARGPLARHVEETSDLFAQRYASGPPARQHASVSLAWRLDGTAADGDSLAVAGEEREGSGQVRPFAVRIPARQLADRLGRNLWSNRLWYALLSARSDDNMRRIESAIRQLEEDDEHGG